MTALPVTKEQAENLKKDPDLRKQAYRILKSGKLEKLDEEISPIVNGPSFSYREVLNLWKNELEGCVNDKQFLNSLGVQDFLNPDFSLLGLNMEKLPHPYNHPEIIKSPSKDLDEIWKQQEENNNVELVRLEDPLSKIDDEFKKKFDKLPETTVLVDGPGPLTPEEAKEGVGDLRNILENASKKFDGTVPKSKSKASFTKTVVANRGEDLSI